MRPTARVTLCALLIAGLTLSVGGPAFAAPTNDGISGATVVTSLPFTDTINTTDTAAAAETTSAFCEIGHTVWYRFTATTDGYVRADTFGSSFDTVIVAYADTGTGLPAGLDEVGCDDDEGRDGLTSQLTLPVTDGTTYLIQVGGCCNMDPEAGSLTFHLEESGPPFGIESVTIVRATVSRHTGVVTVTGTITCLGTPEAVVIDVEVVQRVGTGIVTGTASAQVLDCRGATMFTAVVNGSDGRFKPGRAHVDVSARSQTDLFETSTSVRLRRR
jgi:hypothetical protein